jgi:hypothetical protein
MLFLGAGDDPSTTIKDHETCAGCALINGSDVHGE